MNAQATKTKAAFKIEVQVGNNIAAAPQKIWALLTDAGGFAKWNSTVSSIDGQIVEGGAIVIRVPSTPRPIKLNVSAVKPDAGMVWSMGFAPMFKAVRTFTLTPKPDGTTDFHMIESMAGLMLPMIAGSLPDFVPMFTTYAADLKKAAEA